MFAVCCTQIILLFDTCGGAELYTEEHNSLYDCHQVYTRRQRSVKETCQRYGVNATYGTVPKYTMNRLRWMTKMNMVMCFVAKVSTVLLL